MTEISNGRTSGIFVCSSYCNIMTRSQLTKKEALGNVEALQKILMIKNGNVIICPFTSMMTNPTSL